MELGYMRTGVSRSGFRRLRVYGLGLGVLGKELK